jgi:hypothetical protein
MQSDGPQKIPDPPPNILLLMEGGSNMMLNNVPRSTVVPRLAINKESRKPPPPRTVLPLTERGGSEMKQIQAGPIAMWRHLIASKLPLFKLLPPISATFHHHPLQVPRHDLVGVSHPFNRYRSYLSRSPSSHQCTRRPQVHFRRPSSCTLTL